MEIMNAEELLRLSKEAELNYRQEVLTGRMYKHVVSQIETAALEGHERLVMRFGKELKRELYIIQEELIKHGYSCQIGSYEERNILGGPRTKYKLIIDWSK